MNAFVFLMFKGDRYLPGVLVTAWSILRTGTDNDIICMVTGDVPETAIDEMEKLGIKIHRIDYLQYKTKPMLTKKQRVRYGAWSDVSYTKWQCLGLTQYQKVLFLDADMVVNKNIDHVFDIPAPAAVFSHPWMKKEENLTISPAWIKKALTRRGFVNTATCVLLEPNEEHLEIYKAMLDSMQPFGFNSYSCPDEQSIAYLYSMHGVIDKTSWHNLGTGYAFMEWKYKALGNDAPVLEKYITDFMGENKPWEVERGKWEDLEAWFVVAEELVAETGARLQIANPDDIAR
jgi:lipopolysaccharide biosynthesis glycosyltransferase